MATTTTTEEGRLEFKHGHLAGQTGLAFAVGMGEANEGHQTTVHLLTGGADCLACVRTSESSFKDAETEINDHEDAITCLAANRISVGVVPTTTTTTTKKNNNLEKSGEDDNKTKEDSGKGGMTDLFATGSEDGFVKLYSFPDAVFEANAARFELPVRCVDFAPNGRTLAAGGDDQGVRLVRCAVAEKRGGEEGERDVSCEVLRTLRTVGRSTKTVRFDPEGDYVAAVSSCGVLQVWNSKTGEQCLTKKQSAPKFDSSSPHCCHVSWHPEGIQLAVPGPSGEVAFLERLSWEEEFVLPSSADGEKEGHRAACTCVEISPNGLYAASAALDRRVVVWRLSDQKPIASRSADSVVCNLRWHPTDNALCLTDDEGSISTWEGPVASDMPHPAAVAAEEGEEEGAAAEGGREDSQGPSEGGLGGGAKRRKVSRLGKIAESDSEEEEGGEGGIAGATGPTPPAALAPSRRAQPCFQPGATPAGNSTRRFLAYNTAGCVSTLRGPDYNSVEVSFHDVSARNSRIPTLTDYFGFELGALGPSGTILASRARGAGKPSVVMYRPFESWAAGSEWTSTFPEGEEAKCVACGSSFAACATEGYLRVFSLAGSPVAVISLAGRCVALAASGSHLAVAYVEDDLAGQIRFQQYDVPSGSLVASGPMCLSRESELEWLGFSDDGVLASWDGETLRGYFPESFGGSWVPLFTASAARKAETEHHYVIGLDISAREVFCVITRSKAHFPQVYPRPIITTLPLLVPVVRNDAEDDNAAAMHQGLMFHRLDRQSNAVGITQADVEMDKTLLRLIQGCIRGDRLEAALSYASELNLQRSLQGALKLAVGSKKRNLGERISALLNNRESVVQAVNMEKENNANANIFSRKRVYGTTQ